MSYYDCEKKPLTMRVMKYRKEKAVAYCKWKGVTLTTLISMFLDELPNAPIPGEKIRRKPHEAALKIHNSLGGDEPPVEESFNDERGGVKKNFYYKDEQGNKQYTHFKYTRH